MLPILVPLGQSATTQRAFWSEPVHYGEAVKLKEWVSDDWSLAAPESFVRFFPNPSRYTNDELGLV